MRQKSARGAFEEGLCYLLGGTRGLLGKSCPVKIQNATASL